MPRPIISWRTPSVEVAYICSLAATSLAANYASIVFGSAHAAVSHSKFPIHSDPLFETGCRVVIALCCPMVLELVQDYLFNPSSLQADVLIKTLIVMMFWIPNIANYTLCIKGHAHPVLLASVIQTQFMATAYTIMLLLNFYNCEIFTSKWVHLLFTSSAMLIAMRTLYNFTGRVLFYYLSFPIQSVLIVAGPLYMLYWLYGNWRLIVNVLMLRGDAVEKAAVGSSSGIRLLFYVLLFFIFAVFFVVAGALSVLELSGGRLYIFSQVLLVALLGILPGRLARLEAVCSDVRALVLVAYSRCWSLSLVRVYYFVAGQFGESQVICPVYIARDSRAAAGSHHGPGASSAGHDRSRPGQACSERAAEGRGQGGGGAAVARCSCGPASERGRRCCRVLAGANDPGRAADVRQAAERHY